MSLQDTSDADNWRRERRKNTGSIFIINIEAGKEIEICRNGMGGAFLYHD